MRRLLIIFFLSIICSCLLGQTYYVASDGNDITGNGSVGTPWATINKALTVVNNGGDTVFVRGGTYAITSYIDVYNEDGSAGNPICIFNYPGEVPVFDGINYTTGEIKGMKIMYSSYLHIKGLRFTRINQQAVDQFVMGIYNQVSDNLIIEQCIVSYIGGNGFQTHNSDYISYVNCDAYMCCDTLRSGYPGNGGAGFSFTGAPQSGGTISYYGCRASMCSDDGFHGDYGGLVTIDRCWAYRNGLLQGSGNGFKPGYLNSDVNPLARRIINCIATYNRDNGFHENGYQLPRINGVWYNNTSYNNGSYGFMGTTTAISENLENENIYKNNIAYANSTGNYSFSTSYWIHEYNSFDIPVTVTNADFVSVDSTGLSGARQADGSLPILEFLHIDGGSDLIGAGIGVGLVYDGDSLYHNDPPDLGAFAYDGEPPEPPLLPEVTTTAITTYNSYMATLGGDITSDGGGTLTASGIVWSTDINPNLTDNVIQAYKLTEGSFSVILRNIGGGETIHIRSFATNESGSSYGADCQLITPSYSIMKYNNKTLMNNGKILIFK